MNLVGLMPCRNEDWILGLSARVALTWCDRLVILDHASTDGTERIIYDLEKEYDGRITSGRVQDGQWYEMDHRQYMLGCARAIDCATHIALIDADEILTGNLLGSIREHVEHLSTGQMLTLPLYNLRGGLNRYHANGVWGQRVTSVAFKDTPAAAWTGSGQHHREPFGVNWQRVQPVQQGDGGVMHLWGASERRLIAKHALYKVNEILKPVEQRDYKTVQDIDRAFSWSIKGDTKPPYAHYGTPETWTYLDVPDSWWRAYQPDPLEQVKPSDYTVPWQEAEVRRLVAEHGREKFEGLDLFGVA